MWDTWTHIESPTIVLLIWLGTPRTQLVVFTIDKTQRDHVVVSCTLAAFTTLCTENCLLQFSRQKHFYHIRKNVFKSTLSSRSIRQVRPVSLFCYRLKTFGFV